MISSRSQLLIAIILFVCVTTFSQSLPPLTADDQLGTQPFQSYHGGDIDHIGLSNGTLSLDFPFLSYPQRGQLQLSFHLYYNNHPQHLALFCSPTKPPQCNYMWGYTPAPTFLPLEKGDAFVGWAQQMGLTGTGVSQKGSTTNAPTWYYERWSIQTADGATHPLGNMGTMSTTNDCGGCNTPSAVYTVGSGPWESLDATGIRVNGSLTATHATSTSGPATGIVLSDGVIAGSEDPNGNMITTTSTPGFVGPTNFTDTLGRQIPGPPTPASTSNANTALCPSGPLAVTSAISWSVPGPNGGTSTYIFCYVQVTINDGPGLANTLISQPTTSTKLQSIVLPDGHNWGFQYNDPGDGSTNNNGPINYGTLTQITLPTGGTISYTYTTTGSQTTGCQNAGRFVTSRIANANDGNGDHTWTYSYAITNTGITNSPWSIATTVTDPLGNQTVHTFSSLYAQDNCPAYEAQTQLYQGAKSPGTLLKTVTTTYHFTPGDNKNGPLNVVPTQITTTWSTGKTAQVSKSYDLGFSYTGYTGSTGNSGIYGKELSESASDYGNNAAGATLKTTNTSYRALSNSSYLAANLLDLVSSQSVSDGNGCKQAETDTTYDEPNYLTAYPSTLPAGTHAAAPNSVRGNPTTVTRQLFAANSCPTTAQGGPTSHTNWYDTGEVYKATDPLGNTTTHSYDTYYAGAYSTKTCNALSQCVSGTYDFNTGLLTTFTDANGSSMASGNTPGDAAHTTTLQYNDPLWRLTQVQSPADPSGNNPVTTIKYPDANTVERLKTITASLTDDSFSYFDGVGRHYKSVHTSAGSATAVTTYDADGRVASVTNPYYSTTDPTHGVTQTQYDGLGRATQTTMQDGSAVTIQYNQSAAASTNGDCTLTQDEAGHLRKACTDGLGRLIEVDEPQASSGSMANPYVTLYSYDALGNLLSVNQKGDGSQASRVRNFTYDSLSRLLTATNPESGTITYSYDANGNLLQKTSPAPNQAGTSTQTISYCYDALNRVTGKAYSAQSCPLSSPVVTYSYDAGSNGIGRLTSLADQAGSGSYTYDALGRIASEQRTIAGIQKSLSYTYNLDSSVATLTYPSGAVITYTPDAAGRMLSAMDSISNINYVTGASYGPDNALTGFTSGQSGSFTGITNSFTYNSRLQPVTMATSAPACSGSGCTASVTFSGQVNMATSSAGVSAPNAAANSSLAAYFDPNGVYHMVYQGSNQHLYEIYVTNNVATGYRDLTLESGSPLPAAGTAVTVFLDSSNGPHWSYVGSDQHVYLIYESSSGWFYVDLSTWAGGSPLAAPGSLLTSSFQASDYGLIWSYVGSNQHLYELDSSSGTHPGYSDVTTAANAPLAAGGSALSFFLDSYNTPHWSYIGNNQHVDLIYQNSSGYSYVDLTTWAGGSPLATAGSPLTSSFQSSNYGLIWSYLGSNQHVYALSSSNSSPPAYTDVTVAASAPAAAAGSALAFFLDSYNTPHWSYIGSDQHVYLIYQNSSGYFYVDLTTWAGGSPPAAAGSLLTSSFLASDYGVVWSYVGSNQHIYELYSANGVTPGYADLTVTAPKMALDAGTVSLQVGGFTATACFGGSSNSACTGQVVNNSVSQVAAALAQQLNAANSPVAATASGATITMTWKTPGTLAVPISPLSSTHDNPSLFPNPSFTSSAASFSGGTGANQAVFSIGYDFHFGNGDNGNVFGITNNRDTTRNQTFTYDALNRLISAQNAGTNCTQHTVNGLTEYWGNSYGYDSWGNLLQKNVTKCSAENLSVSVLANNQLVGYGYDAAGNMTYDATTTNHYSYDQENRITGAAGYTYTYDADGNRVEKSNGSTGTIYWYMSPGIVAESDLSGNLKSEYVFFDGERVARKDFSGSATSVLYYFSDHLNTASVITDSAGTIKEDEDYYPWGGELQFVNSDSNHYKFTSKERDSETGLDYFGARYYGNWLGRFITPDWSSTPVPVPYADLDDPQSLNQYSYVRNVPTSKADPDGHCPPCDVLPTPTADDWQLITEAGYSGWAAAGTVGVAGGLPLTATIIAANHPMENHPADDPPNAADMMLDALNPSGAPVPTGLQSGDVGLSAAKSGQQLLGNARGVDEEKSQSDDAQDRERTNGGIVKPDKGPGSVPKDQRDKKRSATRAERQKLLDEQKGICPWCGKPITVNKSATHHVKRHADGGRTKKPNLKVVCEKPCHRDIHK